MSDAKRERGGRIVTDPEAQAIAAVGKILAALDDAARARVLAWANGRYTAPQRPADIPTQE